MPFLVDLIRGSYEVRVDHCKTVLDKISWRLVLMETGCASCVPCLAAKTLKDTDSKLLMMIMSTGYVPRKGK